MKSLKDLKDWYYPKRKELVKESLNIGHSNILCLATFFDNHISYLENNSKNKSYLPYFERAIMVAEIVNENKNN